MRPTVPAAGGRLYPGPGILIQQESLEPRILLRGLETLKCTKVFRSTGTHPNTFCQEKYDPLV